MIAIWIVRPFALLPSKIPSLKATFWTIGFRWLYFGVRFNAIIPGTKSIAFNYDWLFGQENTKFREYFHTFGPFMLSRADQLEKFKTEKQSAPIPNQWQQQGSKIETIMRPQKRGSKKRVYK